MEHTNYAARLRYLAADAVDDSVVDYDALDVRGPDGAKLGNLDGFIVDADAGRVYYAVVDTAGWFRTKQLLLPIGHATLDSAAAALRVDVTRDALSRYPEFEASRFQQFTDEDLRRFESRTVEACCPGDETVETSGPDSAYDRRKHYAQPAWWQSRSSSGERLSSGGPARATAGAASLPVAGRHDREHVIARESREGPESDDQPRREEDDLSPHYGGRAQPGDVLGIETGGERTHVGESPEDENTRRREAEQAVADDPPRRSER